MLRNGLGLGGLFRGELGLVPRSGSAGPSPPAPMTSIIALAAAADIATSNTAPITSIGQSVDIPVNGWAIQLNTTGGQTVADATRMVVNIQRPGYSGVTGSGITTWADTARGTKLIRRPYPNSGSNLLASGSSFIVAIDNFIHAADTITSIVLQAGFFTGQVADITIPGGFITNNSTRAYPEPFGRPITLPFRRVTNVGTWDFEFIVGHEWGRLGRQVARVEARAKKGASTYGPWAGSNAQVVSSLTPLAGGRAPTEFVDGAGITRRIPAPCFRVSVSFAGLADSISRSDVQVVYRFFGHSGNVVFDSEVNGTALLAAGGAGGMGPPRGLPVILDTAGNHTPIYAWINRDGTGLTGASVAGISTGTTDPGAANSYQSEAAAMTAARTWNNTGGNRPTPHNTTSGIILLFRDVTSTALGENGTAYWQRASMVGFSDGLVPPVLSSASYLSTGTTTINCRRRGVQDDGTTVATNKQYDGVFEFRGLTLDAINVGITNAHVVIDGTTAAGFSTTLTNMTTNTLLVDCDIRETAGNAAAAATNAGWRYDLRVDQGGLTASEQMGGVANVSTRWGGLVTTVGSRYSNPGSQSAAHMVPHSMVGCWLRNIAIRQLARLFPTNVQPVLEYQVFQNIRIDAESYTGNAIFIFGAERPPTLGTSIQNLFIRRCGTTATPSTFSISADAVSLAIQRVSIGYLGIDSGAAAGGGGGRMNIAYNDQRYLPALKDVTIRFAAGEDFNTKDDLFLAPELPNSGAGAGSLWAANTEIFAGDLRFDSNATPALRQFYQAITNFTSGAVEATDLADTTRWFPIGQVNGVAYAQQPRRTGNWQFQHAVRNVGNVMQSSAQGTTFTPTSWYGEVPWRNGAIQQNAATYWKIRTGGTGFTLTQWGDHRPQVIAQGDANNSPLLNRVPAGESVMPFDLYGRTRFDDGTGSAGPIEREP